MILPTKHIGVGRSLLGVGAILLEQLQRPQTVTALWEQTRTHAEVGSFERFSLAQTSSISWEPSSGMMVCCGDTQYDLCNPL